MNWVFYATARRDIVELIVKVRQTLIFFVFIFDQVLTQGAQNKPIHFLPL